MTKSVNIRKELRKLVAPIFVEVLLMMTLGVIDTFMLGHYSDDAVAAVGMVNQILNLLFLLFTVINAGTSVLISQYLGAKLNDRLVQAAGVALILNFILGTIISISMCCFADDILTFMGLRPELMQYGKIYMQIVGGFAVVQALETTVSAILRSVDKPIYPMVIIGVVNVLNVLGNYALIFGKFGMPALGVEGAAISTSFSRIVAMTTIFIILFKTTIPKFPKRLFMPFPTREMHNLLRIGLPSAGENMSYELQQITLLYFINQISNEALATRTYVVNIVMFVYLFAICMAQGGAIEIGHMMGRGKVKAAYFVGKYVWHRSLMLSFLFSLTCAILGKYLISMLTSNEIIIGMACTIFWVDLLLEPGKTVNIYATNALRATGDVNFAFWLGVIVQWGVGVLFGYLFGIVFGWGLIGMWFAFVLDEDIRGLVFIQRWNSFKWAKKQKFV